METMRAITAPAVALLSLCFFAATANAQSISVSTTAEIETPVTGSSLSALEFGTLPKGETSTVAASASGAACLVFSGDASDQISVTLPETATMSTNSGAGGEITVSLDRAQMMAGTHENIANADALDGSAGSATLALSGDDDGDGTVGDGLGQAWLWVGGSATPAAHQQQGSYSGTFTVTVAYSN